MDNMRNFFRWNGGKFRRWFEFQRVMNKKRWLEPDASLNGPITLYDFSRPYDAVDALLVDETGKKGGWRISDDSVIGGYSKATMTLLRTSQEYKMYQQGQDLSTLHDYFLQHGDDNETNNNIDNNDDTKNSNGTNKNNPNFIPFIRWEGTTSTKIGDDKRVQRSGFCAIRSPEFPFSGVGLGGRYNGIELQCRSDGRNYTLILSVETLIPDDLYQCSVSIPPTIPKIDDDNNDQSPPCPETGGKFDRVVLLFDHFNVYSGGRLRARQRILDNSVVIQHIGLTLKDGRDGDFQFDLASVRAINYDQGGVIGNVD